MLGFEGPEESEETVGAAATADTWLDEASEGLSWDLLLGAEVSRLLLMVHKLPLFRDASTVQFPSSP